MTFTVQNSMIPQGASTYYEDGWLAMIESHLLYLQSPLRSDVISIDPHDAFVYAGDFGGLMREYRIAPEYQFVMLRVNGMFAPHEYSSDMLSLIVPTATAIEALRRIYSTVSKKTNAT